MRKALKIGEIDKKIISFSKPQYSCLSFNRRFVLLNDKHQVVSLPDNRRHVSFDDNETNIK